MNSDSSPSTPAMQFMILALIASHPNKKELLAAFDTYDAKFHVEAIASGGGVSAAFRKELNVYRALIESHL